MSKRPGVLTRAQRAECYRLIHRHARQIGSRDKAAWPHLARRMAITFRPGDYSCSFHDKHLRLQGMSVAIVLGYDAERRQMPIRGYRSHLRIDGNISYGLEGDREFLHDGRQGLRSSPSGGEINVWSNQSLADLLVRMDAACSQHQSEYQSLPVVPQMPRVLLGFAPNKPPVFETTPALKWLAARRANIPLRRLDTNPPALVDRLLRDVWKSTLRPPGSSRNPTDLLLVDAEYCTQARRALRVFEDFRDLVGAFTRNPARDTDILRVENPAAGVLAGHGIDGVSGFNQPIPHQIILEMEREMRLHLGDLAVRFSQEDLLDALTAPSDPVVACSEALPRLRAKMQPYWSECASDSDLRRAACSPQKGLYASGACRIQVVQTRLVQEPLCFGPDDLRRRMELDWRLTPVTESPSVDLPLLLQTV